MRKGLALSIPFRIFTYNKEIKVMKNETKQQTAVEFLAEQFDNIVELYPSQFEKINNAIEQAKAMEKEQIVSVMITFLLIVAIFYLANINNEIKNKK